jgi:pyruvate dehydrogenase E1 component alpha subunit
MPRTALEVQPSLEHLSILDDDDHLDADLEPSLDDELLLRMHRVMLLSRRFDDRRLKWQRSGRIGTFAPVKGQEAAEVGAVSALRDDDWMVPSFREVAASIWRGSPLAGLILYDAGFNEGGEVPDGQRDLPIAIPVASQIPHAVGLAYASRYLDTDDVVLVFFGDGATSEGDFHEAMNFAGVFELPVVFACQNNQWAISLPREEQTASKSLAQKALAYGFPGLQVDGNDVLACHVATGEAVDRARSGGGPTLLELCTYRLSVHTTADDPTKYRSEEEEEEWRRRDPIPRYQRYLKGKGILVDDDIEQLEKEITEEIDEAWRDARDRMEELSANPGHMFEHVYADMPVHLREQRETLGEGERRG